MEIPRIRRSTALVVLLAAAAAVAVLFRHVISALLIQFAAAYLLMALALPVCRLLEKKLPPSPAAALAFTLVGLTAAAVLLIALPPIAGQFRQLGASLPGMLEGIRTWADNLQLWLSERGMDAALLRDELFSAAGKRIGTVVSSLAGSLAGIVQSAGKLFLAPLLAFYLLRDRRRIATRLLLIIPVSWRMRTVRAAREMKRETLGFLRGQLLLSASVGVLTAVGLLLTGTPGWLALGVLMGVMELIPYIGPWIAGIPAVLLALQGGMARGLWTLGVILIIQQIEGGVLSPHLLSGATQLHPVAVLAAISAGGILAGAPGMLLAIPVLVSIRGAARGLRV